MKLAIMQPYFFPYIGYFQLLNAVDKFVVYDDVTYIKQGWVNRNAILIGGKASMFTVPLIGASSNKCINQINVGDLTQWKKSFIKTVNQNYKKAPFFEPTFELIKNVFDINQQSISNLCVQSLKAVMAFTDIKTTLIESSVIYNNQELKAQNRVIDICLKENAQHYINPIGGSHLYSKDDFLKKGINLSFIKPIPAGYQQFNSEFVPWLSILDVLMFNSKEEVKGILEKYTLV